MACMNPSPSKRLSAISLFASGGVGDLALRESGVDVLVANELLKERASIFRYNFPDTEMFDGDIWDLKDKIVEVTKKKLADRELDIVLATPPCQGMSKNGQGKLLQGIRDGKKPKVDFRNRLIIPTLEIIVKLHPKIVIFENVPEMRDTFIDDENGITVNIIDYIKDRLGKSYVGREEVVEFADLGIPQRRKRLITIFSREEILKEYFKSTGTFIPERTHANRGEGGLKKWVSVRETIGDVPSLNGKSEKLATSSIPFHNVQVLDPKKYIWIENTPPEGGAFHNQCINPKCLFQENPTHGSTRNAAGINRASNDTPLYCLRCNSLLPRPYTVDEDGSIRLMAGFTSAYKRMSWDLPSPTLTTNMCYPSSDHKLHPDQNRVLSLYEGFKLHTLDKFDFEWKHEDGRPARDTHIREIIGESIPPMAISIILKHLLRKFQESRSPLSVEQLSLTY